MKEITYKCTLLSDVVLNSSLATECNMSSLDYIPGSNFLGIVAAKLYQTLSSEEAFEIFHSGKVSFGDALITKGDKQTYAMPFSVFLPKINDGIGKTRIHLHHLIDIENPPKDANQNRIQLKQERGGFVDETGMVIKNITKAMAIKSAQDRETRTSKESAMFGFESLQAGQEFIFTIRFENDTLIEQINKALEGTHRLGKSKNAEFGQVKIISLKDTSSIKSFKSEGYTLVYAQSNLCFVDEYGQASFQPSVQQLGLEKGNINWQKSQIRTHTYYSWNGIRNTTNTQRDCIVKGSVFYIENATPIKNTNSVGLHQAEGLGRVIYNPVFLKESALFSVYKEAETVEIKTNTPSSILGKFLQKQATAKTNELEISKAIHTLIHSDEVKTLKKEISSSQWGGIRAYATKILDNKELYNTLFHKDEKDSKNNKGYLTHGVAYEKQWGKNKDKNLNAFKAIFEGNEKLGNTFIAKFAAEMAKESRRTNDKIDTNE